MMVGCGESCMGWRVRRFPAEYKILLVASKRPNHLWATPNFQLNGILGVLSPAIKSDDDKKLIAHVHLLP
jgi:hypothetical protein